MSVLGIFSDSYAMGFGGTILVTVDGMWIILTYFSAILGQIWQIQPYKGPKYPVTC